MNVSIWVFNLIMSWAQDNLQMTFINRSVVISRAVTILRSSETYLCIGCLRVLPPDCGIPGTCVIHTTRALVSVSR
jgi:hypothetical protein